MPIAIFPHPSFGESYARAKAMAVAALVLAFVTLAKFREAWNGELVLTLVGDEETGGRWWARSTCWRTSRRRWATRC